MSSFPFIRSPQELKKLSLDELQILAAEIRQKILSTCLKNGGHLGASLGPVEIAIALHRVFDSPREPIVWDVGHQAYAHKLLTGRWKEFDTLRLPGGISGFLSRAESEHDVFGAGHSSTSISAALAMAWARGREKTERPAWTVAVIGDGGLTAGLSFEALNNIQETSLGPLLVVLNDNQMSISQNSGALPGILSGEGVREYFELFGFDYVGPMDGHDLPTLIGTLQGLRESHVGRPVLLHAITQKGKGYTPAEERPDIYHGISPVQEKAAGAAPVLRKKSYSEVFGEALCGLAEKDSKIVAITAAMTEGTGLMEFAKRFPDRFFDVGIAEPHAVTFAAGLATQGYKPVVAIYSTFLQRGLDGVIHDVALQNLGVTFAVDRAGIVGADGPTHHGSFDIAYFGMIPGTRISAPTSFEDLASELQRAVNSGIPWLVRYPRGTGPAAIAADPKGEGLEGARWLSLPDAPQAAVFAAGPAATRALQAAQEMRGARVAVCAVQQIKPVPSGLISWCENHPTVAVLTVEDGIERGGFGEDFLKALRQKENPGRRTEVAAYDDHFIPHGDPAQLEDAEGVSARAILERLRAMVSG